MKFIYNDGGRKAAGFKGDTGDCVARAIAIATRRDYQTVYDELAEGHVTQRRSKHTKKPQRRTAREGIIVQRKWFKDYMRNLGWVWTPTMHIGSGCKVHLTDGELPMGRLIVSLSRHFTTVIDGEIYDIYDPQREPQNVYGHPPIMGTDGQLYNPIIKTIGARCVYGYWQKDDPSLR